jgi:hypothetical protein
MPAMLPLQERQPCIICEKIKTNNALFACSYKLRYSINGHLELITSVLCRFRLFVFPFGEPVEVAFSATQVVSVKVSRCTDRLEWKKGLAYGN